MRKLTKKQFQKILANILAFAIIFALLPVIPGSPALLAANADNSVDIDIKN